MNKMEQLIGELKAKLAELEAMALNKEQPEMEEQEDEMEDEMEDGMDLKKATFIAQMKKQMME